MPPSSPVVSSQPPPPPLATKRRLIMQQLGRQTDHNTSDYADNHMLSADHSTLQAAQVQAAELRALHSAVLNGLVNHSTTHMHGLINNRISDNHAARISCERGTPKKSCNYYHEAASLSPASSTADCTIRPVHEYPVFLPSYEDLLLSKEAVNSNRRSSVDHHSCESLREERLNYILDHDNKRNFSGISNSARISSKSLNLPSIRGADNFHHSLNLQQGSLNSLEARPKHLITSIHPLNKSEGASSTVINGSNHHSKLKIKGKVAVSDYTGRQKALLELLSDEAARKKAFNELAAMEATDTRKVKANKGINVANSRRIKVNERVEAHDDNYADVSCDKCRPVVAGGHTVVVPLTDSRDFTSDTKSTSTGGGGKDRVINPFKGWFSRGKKRSSSKSAPSKDDQGEILLMASKDTQSSSSLINAEAEKDLEVAMAMDLLELKVLQANTKRDAAMAELLELRLAMDSMGKKLTQVEHHCRDLKNQLVDVRRDHDDNDGDGDGDDDDQELQEIMTEFDDGDDDGHQRAANMRGIGMAAQQQPSKSEFFNAVAEARVGVRQLCRVLLQHIQDCQVSLELEEENYGKSKGNYENLAPILLMFRDNHENNLKVKKLGGSAGAGRGLRYHLESVINMVFYEHFENVGFDKSGTHKVLDPAQRAIAFYHSFLSLAKHTCTQLLTQASPLYNPAFDRFCARKLRAIGRAVGCAGRLWPDELARTFLAAARGVWLLHHLSFAFHVRRAPPGIFRVASDTPFNSRFMELLPTDHRHVMDSAHLLVSLMVMPGFFLSDDVIKCKVLCLAN